MLKISKGAALALALACGLGACNREDEADKQAALKENAPASALTPGSADLAAWDVRFDDASADAGGFQMSEQAGGGWAVKSGSSGSVTWRDRDLVEGGPFLVKATLATHWGAGAGEGYGVVVGGRHLKDPDRAYTTFVIRGDGEYRIERTEGGSSKTFVDWTPSTALHQAEHGAESEPNSLEIRVEAMATHFLVNGTEVKALATEEAQPYGTAGLRLGKGADVTVTDFEMHGQGSSEAAQPPVLRSSPDSQSALPR